jgi:hypothetical protein
MPTGTQLNTVVVTPSHGLFLTSRGEKYVQYRIIQYIQQTVFTVCMWYLNAKKSLTWGGGHQCKGRTSLYSLHSGPMSTRKLLASPLPQAALFKPHVPTYVTQLLLREDDIGTLNNFFIQCKKNIFVKLKKPT